LKVRVTLVPASGRDVVVNFGTWGGTAHPWGETSYGGLDFVGASGQLIFLAGETTRTVGISVNGDVTFEPTEAFTVRLAGAVGAILQKSEGIGIITNDDPLPRLFIGNVSEPEGAHGFTSFEFPVSLSNPTYQTVTYHLETLDGTAIGTDLAGFGDVRAYDYQTRSGTLTFPPATPDTRFASTSSAIILPSPTRFSW
jgi:hypothetical protein